MLKRSNGLDIELPSFRNEDGGGLLTELKHLGQDIDDAVAVHAVVVIDLIGRAEHRELVRHADALEAALIARLAEHLGHSAAKDRR